MPAALSALYFQKHNETVGGGERKVRKKEKPAAGGGAAGFPIEPNGDWEEEYRRSRRRPWEEEWAACNIEALREEVHRFDKYDYT